MNGRPSVYLAGPITGLTYGESTDWREAVARELDAYGIDAYSPLRAKQYLEAYGKLERNYIGVHPLSEPAGILTRDRYDVTHRDMVFCNLLGAERVSIGTVMEIAWADLARVPLVLIIENEGSLHEHEMIQGAVGYRTPDIDQAMDIVRAVLLP